MDAMISVLIPTRERKDDVIKVIECLYDKATNPDNIEILLRIDDDDVEMTRAAHTLPEYVDVSVGPRYRGYVDLHQHVNELCEEAQGDLYLLWHDDVYMETEGWDEIYAEALGDKKYACFQIKTGTQFPAITKELYQLLGHFSIHCANDSYIRFVVQGTGIQEFLDIEVDHKHGEVLDQTWTDRQAVTKGQHGTFWSERIQKVIRHDRMLLLKTTKPPLPITAYVSGKNGGTFLHNCLSSLWFCDQIIYLDDSSYDGSWKTATEYATDMYRWYGPDSMCERRNYAIGYTGEDDPDYEPFWTSHPVMSKNVPEVRNDWLLYIDDDEELIQGDNLPDMYDQFKAFLDGKSDTLKKEKHKAGFLLLVNAIAKKRMEIQSQSPLMRMFETGTVSWRKDVQNTHKHGSPAGLLPVRLMHYGYGDEEHKFKKLHQRLPHLEKDAFEAPNDMARLNYLLNNISGYAQNNNHLERLFAIYEAIKRVYFSDGNKGRRDTKTLLFLSTRSLWKAFFKNNYVDHFILAMDEVYDEIKEIPDVNHWLCVASSAKSQIDAMIEYGEAFIESADKFMDGSFSVNIELEHMGDTCAVTRMLSDCYYEKSLAEDVYGKKKKYFRNKAKKLDRKFRKLT